MWTRADVQADSNAYMEMQRAKEDSEGGPTPSDPRTTSMFHKAAWIKTVHK